MTPESQREVDLDEVTARLEELEDDHAPVMLLAHPNGPGVAESMLDGPWRG